MEPAGGRTLSSSCDGGGGGMLAGSPIETLYASVAPNPDDFPMLVEKLKTFFTTEFAFPEADIAAIASPALVMVGDGPQDVLAGRAAGCVTVAVVGPLVPRDRLAELSPDALLDGLDQLPALVERWRVQATS